MSLAPLLCRPSSEIFVHWPFTHRRPEPFVRPAPDHRPTPHTTSHADTCCPPLCPGMHQLPPTIPPIEA